MNIFKVFEIGQLKSAEELAINVHAECLLVVRIMRALVGIGIFKEEGEQVYTHNTLSTILADPTWQSLVSGMCETTIDLAKIPEYLASLGFHNPSDPDNALFHYAHQTKLNMFEWLSIQPESLAFFNTYMAASTRVLGTHLRDLILSLFPSESSPEYEHISYEDTILLVDIGAGHGTTLGEVRKERPDLKGRMIVQDLPAVIQKHKLADGVEAMPFSFLDPQPIKGAYIYYFRHIFHDWPDSVCHQILANTILALSPGYSRLVIVDQVVPDIGAKPFTAFLDLNMMAFGGMERTERHWRQLLTKAGLRIVRVENPGLGPLAIDSVIEAVLDKSDTLDLGLENVPKAEINSR